MIYVLTHFGLWFLAALAVGALSGLYTNRAEPDGTVSPWLRWALTAFVAGVVLAILGVLQGRAGLWLETGLWAFAAFLLGAAAGALGHSGAPAVAGASGGAASKLSQHAAAAAESLDHLAGKAVAAAESVGHSAKSAVAEASDGVSHLAHDAAAHAPASVTEAAAHVSETVSHALHEASEGVSHLAHEAAVASEKATQAVQHAAASASESVSHLAHDAGVSTPARFGNLSRHRDWALGLLPLALVWVCANVFEIPKIESALATSVAGAAKEAGAAPPPQFAVLGRDVVLDGANKASGELRGAVSRLDGVRLVGLTDRLPVSEDGVAALEPADKVAKEAEKGVEAVKAEANKLADDVKADAKAAKQKADEAAASLKNEAAKAAKALTAANAKVESGGEFKPAPIKSQAEKAKAAKEELAAIPAKGGLDLAACQKGLNATQGLEKIQFRSGSSTITRAAAYVIDRLTPLMARCPETKIEIGGHTDNVGDEESNQALSQRRAEAVLHYLVREGVAAARLSATGYGAKQPLASNDTEDGRAENRRIEFVLK